MNMQSLVVKNIFYRTLADSVCVTEIKINIICCVT